MITYTVAAVLIGLASFRLWRILALDSITEPIRYHLFVKGDPGRAREWFDLLAGCAWCLGWWIAGGLSALTIYAAGWDWWSLALLWPASSAVTGLVSLLERDDA